MTSVRELANHDERSESLELIASSEVNRVVSVECQATQYDLRVAGPIVYEIRWMGIDRFVKVLRQQEIHQQEISE